MSQHVIGNENEDGVEGGVEGGGVVEIGVDDILSYNYYK